MKDDPAQADEDASRRSDLAIVLDGGGARAAYQVGFLRSLVRYSPDLALPIITGVSAGAINAAFLAARRGSLTAAVDTLTRLWSTLKIDRVFRADTVSLLSHVVGWGLRLVSGGGLIAPQVRGLVETAPLHDTLVRHLAPSANGEITAIADNLEAGRLRALAIVTSSYSTGQSVAWVQGCDIQNWERSDRRSRKTRMTVEHIMASAALPLFFPAVQLDGAWHGDGGIRLTAPSAPAIHLGARRILAVSTRYPRSMEEADQRLTHGYPPPLQIAGQLLNATFLDDHDRDTLHLEQLNVLLRELPPTKRHGLRPVDHVVIRPSRDLGQLAHDYEPRLPRLFRHLTRSVGSRETASPDLLSLLMFEPDYLARLIEIGEADAEARLDEIRALLGP